MPPDDPKQVTRAQAGVGVPLKPAPGAPAGLRIAAVPSRFELHLQLFGWNAMQALTGQPFEVLDSAQKTVVASGRTDAKGILHAEPPGIAAGADYWLRVPQLFLPALRTIQVFAQPKGLPPQPVALTGVYAWSPNDPKAVFGPSRAPLLANKDRAGGRVFLRELAARNIDQIGPGTAGIKKRDELILEKLLAGHMPDFCREWAEVNLSYTDSKKVAHAATLKVMPDCIAIGSNEDFVRVNLSGYTSQRLADEWGCLLPTPRIVRAVHLAASPAHQLFGHPLAASGGAAGLGDGMHQMATETLIFHEDVIQGRFPCAPEASLSDEQKKVVASHRRNFGAALGHHKSPPECTLRNRAPRDLVCGHKKEVVIPYRGNDRLTFCGMLESRKRTDAILTPAEPEFWTHHLSPHGAGFTDYSQGTRLVHPVMLVDGQPRGYAEVLMDADLFGLAHEEYRRNTRDGDYLPGKPLKLEELKYPNPSPANWKG